MDYVLYEIIFTLAAVETPVPGGTGSEKYGLLDSAEASSKRSDDPISTTPKSYYVSSGIRSALRHIQSEAGDLSTFRGLGTYMSSCLLFMILTWAIGLVLGFPAKLLKAPRFVNLLTFTLSRLALEQVDAAWTHIVISKPRHKFWFRRLPLSFLTIIRTLWLPVVAYILMYEAIEWVPSLWSSSKPPQKVQNTGSTGQKGLIRVTDGPIVGISFFAVLWMLLKFFLSSLITPALKVAFLMPIETIHRRIQASLLPDEDDPIVPMDRSFSNGPNSGILHQQQPLDFVRAYQTLDKATYIRLAKYYIKATLIKKALEICFFAVILSEITALVGRGTMWIMFKVLMDVPIVQQDVEGISGGAWDILSSMIINSTVVVNATAAAAASSPVTLLLE